jgi:dipeptide/tripeptide permease
MKNIKVVLMIKIKGKFFTCDKTKKRNLISKVCFIILFLSLFFGTEVKAQSISIWQTYAIVNVNGGGNTYYDLLAST